MKGLYWVTPSGDVVESIAAFTKPGFARGSYQHGHETAPCRRVGSNAYVGTRRLDRLRPATTAEVKAAREKWDGARRRSHAP